MTPRLLWRLYIGPLVLLLIGCASHQNQVQLNVPSDLSQALANGTNLANSAALVEYSAALERTIAACQTMEDVDYPSLLEIVARIERLDASFLRRHEAVTQREVLRAPATAVQCSRVLSAICGALVDADMMLDTLARLPADEDSMPARSTILGHALGDLYERKNYFELIRNRDVIVSMAAYHARGRRNVPEAIETAATLYEAYLAQGRVPWAEQMSAWMLSVSASTTTYDLLIAAAERLSKQDEVSRLRAQQRRLAPNVEEH